MKDPIVVMLLWNTVFFSLSWTVLAVTRSQICPNTLGVRELASSEHLGEGYGQGSTSHSVQAVVHLRKRRQSANVPL